jgi:hypothetical protein
MTNFLHRTAKSAKGKIALTLLGVFALAFSAGIVYAATSKPDFKLSVTKSKKVSAGSAANFTVSVKRTHGFKKNVTLGVKGLPGGAKATWKSKTKVKGKVVAAATCKKHCNVLDPKTSSATLTVTTSNGTPIGLDKFQVTGKGGGVSHTVKNLQLIVQPPVNITGQPNPGTTGSTGNTGTPGTTGNTGGSGGGTSTPPPNPTYSVSPAPATQNVVQTDTTSFTINIDRSGGYTGAVSFGTGTLPQGVSVTFAPASTVTGNSVTMNVQTDDTTPSGNQPFTVKGTAAGIAGQTTNVTLNVQNHVPFTISGAATGVSPGADTPLNLTLSNPYNFALQVTGISVAFDSTTPLTGATNANGGCHIADFSLIQINRDLTTGTGTPITLPANASNATLTSLGVNSVDLPKLHMANTTANQDDCQGATVNFNFSGTSQK